ncbi:hypothetical protein E2C01_030509 [Portunus trituberculatus]|uniref:Uncharacterized protein n=1 Tax=Portunus trituberculatus TaxID=210409 RepID=A0A5B7EUF3_PORTR|nr:hypothetical protein [Portunus trituberculatus]
MHSIPGIQGVFAIKEVPVIDECPSITSAVIRKSAIHCNSPGQPSSPSPLFGNTLHTTGVASLFLILAKVSLNLLNCSSLLTLQRSRGLPDVALKWEEMTYCEGTYVSRLKEVNEKKCKIPPLAPGPILRGRDSYV